jgi:hypothetical protein
MAIVRRSTEVHISRRIALLVEAVPLLLTRVNSTNVLDEGLRIGVIGRRMNSNVKISQTRHVLRINVVVNLAYSQSVPNQPLLAPIYRWPGLKELLGPIHITISIYDMDSYFDYDYTRA